GHDTADADQRRLRRHHLLRSRPDGQRRHRHRRPEPVADLAITKTASLTTAAPGAAVSYTLSVTNASGSNAQDVVITDAVANQSQLRLTAVTGTTGGATCPTPQPGSLRCTVASLA